MFCNEHTFRAPNPLIITIYLKVRDELKTAGTLPSEELIFDPASGKKFPCSTNIDDTERDRDLC